MNELQERLAELTEEQQRALLARLAQRQSRQPRNTFPLSSSQRRLWVLDRIGANTSAYNVPAALRLVGRLNLQALQDCFGEIARRHQALRTVFEIDASTGEPSQVVQRWGSFEPGLVDLTSLTDSERIPIARDMVNRETQRPFDLTTGPLLRALLLKAAPSEHILVLTMHHIVSDGWSAGVLTREVIELYRAYCDGDVSPLPELAIQYVDFAAWQNKSLAGDRLDKQCRYWVNRLRPPLPVLELPTRGVRPEVMTSRGAEHTFQIDGELTDRLNGLARREGATLFMTLFAAFLVLLYRYTGQEDLLVGTPVANRTRRELEPLIGHFINTVVLRTALSGNPRFSEVLSRVREAALEGYSNSEVPFESILEKAGGQRDPSRPPIFQVMFALQNAPSRDAVLRDLAIHPFPIEVTTAKFELTASLFETGGTIAGNWEYNTDLFQPDLMRRMSGHYANLLKAATNDPLVCVTLLPMLADEEILQLTRTVNSEGLRPAPAPLLHQWFEVRVRLAPDSIAVVSDSGYLSYQQLDSKANKLANHLRRLGVGPESTVGMILDRTSTMVVAILGVLKSGAAYVPMDPAYPQSRLRFVAQDAGLSVLLTEDKTRENVPSATARIVCLDAERRSVELESDDSPEDGVTPGNLAYVIYTSGSTGKPKGVGVCHEQVIRLFEETQGWYDFNRDDVWTLFHSYAFDFSVWEIWGALLYGGRLQVITYATSRSPETFYDLLCDEQVTVLNQTPSAFSQLIQVEQNRRKMSCLSLRYVVFGGEALDLSALRPWFDRHGDARPKLINMYGITETTVHVTYRPLEATDAVEGRGSLIGSPIPDLQVYSADRNLQLLPAGVPGQMFVGGAGLARGYLDNPALTAERFIPDSLGHCSGRRLYQTGDSARVLSDGDIEYLGRVDHQVKIRGFRIELGEIESTLKEHQDVRGAVVLAKDDPAGGKRLNAYLIAGPENIPSVSDLRAFLKTRLPDYMIPAAFLFMDSFPLTNNGKLDRGMLPEADGARPEMEGAYTAPRSEIEQTLVDAWSEVLGLTRVGIDDNFFELGGDSIRTIQVITRLKVAGLKLSAQEFFLHQTIRELGTRVARETPAELEGGSVAFGLISPEDRRKLLPDIEDAFPLTMLQAGMVFHSHYSTDSTDYHNVTTFHIRADLDEERLKQAVRIVMSRHPVLRASFDLVNFAEPLQLIHNVVEPDIEFEDLSALPASEHEDVLTRWLEIEKLKRFDVTRAPLVRFHIHRRSADTFQMAMTEHHAILDGWSVASLLAELFESYTSVPRGGKLEARRPPPTLFRDFVETQRRVSQSEDHKQYWRRRLDGRTATLLPRVPVSSRRGAENRTRSTWPRMSSSAIRKMNDLVGQLKAPLKSVLLAVHLRAVSLMTGEDDIVTGVVSHGRPEGPGGEEVLGLFLNTLPFRLTVQEESWTELIRRTFEAEREMALHRLYPMAQIQLDQSSKQLFEIAFNFINFHVLQSVEKSQEIEVIETTSLADTNLTLFANFSQDQSSADIRLNLTARGSEVTEDQLAVIAECYVRAFEALARDPDSSCLGFDTISEPERDQILTESLVDRGIRERESRIHDLFEGQAERTPDAIAVIGRNGHFTYRELDRLSDKIRFSLSELGAGSEDRVAVCVDRCPEMIAALLGILKCAAAYVPIEPGYPSGRIAFMLDDSGAAAVLTQQSTIGKLPAGKFNVVDIDAVLASNFTGAPSLRSSGTVENLAYVIYTSGSTGRPKGVAIEHRSAVEFLHWAGDVFASEDAEAVLASTSISFDLSVFEIFATLSRGGTVVLAANAIELPEVEYADAVTLINTVPSAMSELVKLGALPRSVRTVNLAGEALRNELVQEIYGRSEVERVYNLYGPSEDTTYSTFALAKRDSENEPAIGRPISNTQAYVLDRDFRIAPAAVRGELYLGGSGLARCYLGRPDLTAERFIPDSLSGRDGGRLYRTGDLARRLPSGDIEFLGRSDHQVKIRGFRIELGEIEAALSRNSGVKLAVVLDRKDSAGSASLVAYVLPKADKPVDADSLRDFLKDSLPEHMIPSQFVTLDSVPLTPNGKIDRSALRAIEAPVQRRVRESVPPRNVSESRLAEIWAEVLGIDSVGVTDDFFDLGGHSLLAVRVTAKIKSELHQDVPLSVLVRAGTVEKLARAMGQGAHTESPLIGLQTQGTSRPLFFVHPVGGNILCYVDLARHLGDRQPVYALESIELDRGRKSLTTLEAMAAEYVSAVLKVLPNGPFRLGGWSFGSLVAYEMACQLRKRGEEVDLLALIDGWAPGRGVNCKDMAEDDANLILLSEFAADLAELSGKELHLSGDDFCDGLQEPVESVFELARAREILPSYISLEHFSQLFEVFRNNRLAALNYRPECPHLPENTVLFRATEVSGRSADDGSLGWGTFTNGGVSIRELPGDHYSILRKPNAALLAGMLKELIDSLPQI